MMSLRYLPHRSRKVISLEKLPARGISIHVARNQHVQRERIYNLRILYSLQLERFHDDLAVLSLRIEKGSEQDHPRLSDPFHA